MRNKIIFFASLFILLLFLFIKYVYKIPIKSRATTALVTMSILPNEIHEKISSPISVEAYIDTKDLTISATEIYFIYDPTTLTCDTISSLSFLPVVLKPGIITQGKASIVLGSLPEAPIKGKGMVARLTCRIVSTAPSSIRLTGSKVTAIGQPGNVLETMTESTIYGELSISPSVAPTMTPAPTQSPTLTLTPTPIKISATPLITPTPSVINAPTPPVTITLTPTPTKYQTTTKNNTIPTLVSSKSISSVTGNNQTTSQKSLINNKELSTQDPVPLSLQNTHIKEKKGKNDFWHQILLFFQKLACKINRSC